MTAREARERFGPRWAKAKQLSAASEPEDEDEDEVDETFVALQKLLRSLSSVRAPAPASASAPAASPSTTAAATATSTAAAAAATNASTSREEILESRRRERERFRQFLMSESAASGRRRRRPAAPYCSEDDEEDEPPVQSVESTISSRFMNGSFSRSLNVHVISRDRWSHEEPVVEQLPAVMVPPGGLATTTTDNPKVKVTMTDEHADLRAGLLANLSEEEEQNKEAAQHYLKPPRSTWFIQSQHLETLQC